MPHALFNNHLVFMQRHRGDFAFGRNEVHITGDTPGLASWVPCANDASLPEDCLAVRLLPWSGDSWSERLTALGFAPAEELSYMELTYRLKLRPSYHR